MENLAHSLTGLALAKTGLEQRIPFGSTVLILAANAPDVDVVVSPLGTLYYLHYHRGITHALIGTILIGLFLGLVAWLLRRFSKVPEARLRDCLAIALAGALTHPLLDWTNSYGIRLFQPFSDHRSFGDLVFIVDPALWLILGTGTFLASRWSRPAQVLWGLVLSAILAIAMAFQSMVPGLRWFLGLFLVAVCLTFWVRHRIGVLGRSAAVSSLVIVLAYWVVLAGSRESARSNAVAALVNENPVLTGSLAILPRPVDPWRWQVFCQDGSELLTGTASAWTPGLDDLQRIRRNLDQPEVRASLLTCPGQILAHFGRFTFFEVESGAEGPAVIFRDARFGGRNGSGFGTFRIDLSPDLRWSRNREPCPPVDSLIPCP